MSIFCGQRFTISDSKSSWLAKHRYLTKNALFNYICRHVVIHYIIFYLLFYYFYLFFKIFAMNPIPISYQTWLRKHEIPLDITQILAKYLPIDESKRTSFRDPFLQLRRLRYKTLKAFDPSYETLSTVKKTSQPKFAFRDVGETWRNKQLNSEKYRIFLGDSHTKLFKKSI